MAPRRGAPSSNTLSPQDYSTPSGPPSPAFLGFPRANSPSSGGFTQFLSRPSKWFGRSSSASKLPPGVAEPRASTSFPGGRKHKISRPTDPRPILETYAGPASRSVLDVSGRPPASLDISPFPPNSSTPSTPTAGPTGGLGDLRAISRRGWSKSVDDLGKVSGPSFPTISTSFQDKVAEYRGRSDSNASAMSPSSPASITPSLLSGRHPFPSVQSSGSSSSSPPRSSTLPPVSISISGPIKAEDPGVPKDLSHVHTRSHSFTPKLSSKLAAPRFIPPSPKRKGSGASDRDLELKDLEKSVGAARTGFGFGFGGLAKSSSSDSTRDNAITPAHRSTTYLAPPTIVEPGQESGGSDDKRASQIVYHSGFVNRLTDVPSNLHHANISLSKGWKPFKLELKGSKLYFYKPPGDRITAVKDLFPTELVPPSFEDDDDDVDGDSGPTGEPDGVGGRGKAKDEGGTVGRKKRAFWGRATHPDLVQQDGKIDHGTFEALVHESVFGTTFLESRDDTTGVMCEPWMDFASSVLLSLPHLVGLGKFETELQRCCSYLISGAEESSKEKERSRVGWIAGEYLRYHGVPADLTAWDEWRQEAVPAETSAAVKQDVSRTMPASSSMQALYAPSPALSVGSPNLGTFSPRPEENTQVVSLLDILKGPEPPSPSKKLSLDPRALEHQPLASSAISARIPWVALDSEGLSRDVLLMSDPHFIAQSLTAFHRSILDQVPENITADFITDSDAHTPEQQSFILLFGSDDQPHWLTKLLLVQVLGADTSSGTATLGSSQLASPARKSADDRNNQTSRTHSRSEVISVWIKVGELCRVAGDECSWQAIAASLCSRPIARLDKAWRRVDAFALAVIESWVYPKNDGEVLTVKEPKLTPWGGDIRQRIKDNMVKSDGSEQAIKRESLETIRRLFDTLRTSFSLCPRRVHIEEGEPSDEIHKMMAYWHDMSLGGSGAGSLAVKFQRVEQFMSLSLTAEPRRKGLFEPHYWTRSPSNHTPQASLLPLLFPEPLPSVHLVDRAQLLRGRIDSDASDIHLLRGNDGHLRLDMRSQDRPVNNNRSPVGDLAALSRGGTVIPVYNGDLLLIVQPGVSDSNPGSRPSSRAPSRPPSSVDPGEKNLSRNPSIRVKPGTSQGLERKPSAARRNSLPSLSQRPNFVMSEPTSEPPLRVLVQAGTLNTLVDILVHGLRNVSVSVADDNGEMSLREGMTRELVVDHIEFAKVWWNVFRSFVTPLVFFELLRKIYINAQTTGPNPPVFDYLQVISDRREVLETIKEWLTVGGGTQDIVDDIQLYGSIQSFLHEGADHSIYQASNVTDLNVAQAWASLQQIKHSLSSIFSSQTMRPPVSRPPTLRATANSSPSRTRNLSAREPPDIDHISPEDLVDNLDGMACAAFTNVTEEDLYITADLLEIQTTDRTGWFSPRDVGTVEEAIEIQTIYSHIQEVEQSSLISELSQDAVYRLLPPGIRSCIRAHGILRKWLISKIVAPRLGLRMRQARIELLVQAIEVARLRNTDGPSATKLAETACVRSFVEAAITSALLSVESRMHHRAWQNVASGRGTHCDSLSSLLARPFTQSISFRDSLTVDMGWLIECMLEIIATPDVTESATPDGQNLVNFDKRRHLCNLIMKAPSLPSTRRKVQPDELNRRGFERLNTIEKEVILLQFDHRGIKDEAVREAMSAPVNGNTSTRKSARPFQRLVLAQVEKNRRDRHLRSRLQKEKVLEQSKNEKRDDLLNRAMRPRKPVPAVQKQHRNKKSMSAFLHFMRPISSAFGAEIPHSPGVKKSASELDFAPSGKPSLVLSLVDAQIAQFINNERSFLFQLDTEDGGHYLFQAMNKRDMTKWMETVKRVAKMAAKRRLTYLGNSPKPQIADHIHNQANTPSRDPRAVFGVELQFLLQRESGSTQVPTGTIPLIIEQCLGEVESRGLTEVGIYRIAGAVSETNALKDAYNRGESPIQNTTDIHAVCDLVKSWFRILPEPIFPSTSYHDIIRAMQLENLDERLAAIRNVVQELPQGNFDILKRVSEHLDKVTDFEEHNQMTAEALAIVFSPNLLRAPQNDFVMILSNMGHTHKLVKALITHFHVIFDEVDAEVEAHSEDDYDSPILEEDEEDEEQQQTDGVEQTQYTPS